MRSRDTFKCSECGLYIPDAEYYTYDKGNLVSKNMDDFYNCCLTDYRMKSIYHDLKVSVTRLKKKKFRAISLGEFYVNNQTGEVTEEIPYQKVPLNADILEAPEIPDEILMQIRTDRLKIKYLADMIRQKKIHEVIAVFQNFDEDMGSCLEITKTLEKRGIPMRYLGRIIEQLNVNYVKEIVAREMIALSATQVILNSFDYLRKLSNKMNEFNLKKSLVFHLNNIMGVQDTDESRAEWRTIIEYIGLAFDCVIEVGVRDKIHLPGLLIRILELIDCKLIVNIDDINFYDARPFTINYFEIFHPRVQPSHPGAPLSRFHVRV